MERRTGIGNGPWPRRLDSSAVAAKGWWSVKNRPFRERLMFALNGLGVGWRRESSIRTQTALALFAVIVLIVLRPPLVWWAIIALMISFVLAAELMNSAFEALVDHLHPERHPEIRVIKDVASGAVLLTSIGGLVVGFLLLCATLWP
jgi:undecaprenol kinase